MTLTPGPGTRTLGAVSLEALLLTPALIESEKLIVAR